MGDSLVKEHCDGIASNTTATVLKQRALCNILFCYYVVHNLIKLHSQKHGSVNEVFVSCHMLIIKLVLMV